MKNIKGLLKYIPVVLIVAAALVILPQVLNIELSDMLSYKSESPWLVAGVLFVMYCVKSVVMVIPIIMLYMFTGMLFPKWLAVIITYIGLTAELSISYIIGRRLGGTKVRNLLEKYGITRRIIGFTGRNSRLTCFISRMLPFPCDVMSMFFGASGIKYPAYLIASLLGMTPVMLPYIFMGDAISNPLSAEFLIPFALCLAVGGAAFAAYRIWTKKADRDASASGGNKSE